LYTIKDVRWNREKQGSLLTLRLSRYIAPEEEKTFEQNPMVVASAANAKIGGTP
jgi:hypothetical protein